jgi:hypothetical protein
MAASTAFTITINTIASGPFSLYGILSTGNAPTGCTLGTGASITPYTGKPIAYVSFQNVSGGLLYLGDSTLTAGTNMGLSIPSGGVEQIVPGRGGAAWANLIYFNASANTTVINVTVVYAT